MNINELIDFTANGRVNAVAIVAVDKHWGIGIDDKLPDFPRLDLHWFKHNTKGKICIVGSKTFETLPELYDRKFIVVSRDVADCLKNKINGPNQKRVLGVQSSIEEALVAAKKLAFEVGQTEVMVIGGAEIYNYCFINKLVDEILISHIWSDQRCNKVIDSAAINLNYRGKLISEHSLMADGKNIRFYKYKSI